MRVESSFGVMDDDRSSSWVRRTNFSHTVCHRLDSFKLTSISSSIPSDRDFHSLRSMPVRRNAQPKPKGSIPQSFSFPSIPSALDGDRELKRMSSSLESSSIDYHIDHGPKSKGKSSGAVAASSMFAIKPQLDHGLFRNQRERSYKTKQRSLSPLPTTVLPESFKEARVAGKRFSTPPPSRRGFDKSPLLDYSSMKALERTKSRKDTSWVRYFDHGGGRVASVETTDEWMVDRSKLYVGERFASGAHSRLYFGVYKGQDVAVKIIRQSDYDENGDLAARLEKQFNREVTHLSHLYHRNVIKLAAVCKDPPVFCIITEFLSGGSLRAFLHKLEHKSLPLQKLIAIALDIARGMEYIHSQGVIHRDMKPENILFDENFCVKIADFGIACEEAYCDVLAEDPGTYRWMAPEMIKHKPYGRKVDVYSFGLLLWEMVTGTIPYEDMTPIQAAFAVVDKNLRPTIPADCPSALRALIEQCWALAPEKRPEFWQIVKVLEQFESALSQHNTLELVQNLTCHDHKKWLRHWIQKLKPSHADGSEHTVPKLL